MERQSPGPGAGDFDADAEANVEESEEDEVWPDVDACGDVEGRDDAVVLGVRLGLGERWVDKDEDNEVLVRGRRWKVAEVDVDVDGRVGALVDAGVGFEGFVGSVPGRR